jgi:VWFA-related protein
MRSFRILAALAVLAVAASAQAPPAPQQNPPASQPADATPLAPPQAAPAGQQTAASISPIKTNTRLITVDVVVTDSHGSVVRGLKPEDFQVSEEHAGLQKIVKFEFIDVKAPPASTPLGGPLAAPPAAYRYSNLLPDSMRVPPTVMLMDALNTNIENQSVARAHMLALLKTLPPATPIAVFELGHSLHIMQSFTSDPALLRAAIDKTLRDPNIEQNPQDDPNSPSNVALDLNGDTETPANLALEDLEKIAFEGQTRIRVDETTDAMVAIAKFLGGYSGRKNLLWFSESFPNWITPNPDFGSDLFAGTAVYMDKIRIASQALADARIAVYPVDARGLDTSAALSASQSPQLHPSKPGGGLPALVNREDNARLDSQNTMRQLAEESGGKVCLNTNDLSGCVQSALDDSSTYYELAYYPERVKWDGRFHKISVKTNQHGLKLGYRSGYVATEGDAVAKTTPAKQLQQACLDPLPSSSVSMTAEALASKQGAPDAGGARYLITISPDSLSLAPNGASRQLNLQMAVCEYNPKGDSFQFISRDLSGPVSETEYQRWKASGVGGIFDFDAKPDDRRLRFAVLDVPSGAIGSVDVPAHPHHFRTLPDDAAASPAPAIPPLIAAPTPPASPHITFRVATGATSQLDWTGDSVSYHGDLSLDQGAHALFTNLFGARYHCQAGALISNDANSTATPKLVLTLSKQGSTGAIVDLGGDAPVYTGELPVDSSARAFFDYLWKLCHCQQP